MNDKLRDLIRQEAEAAERSEVDTGAHDRPLPAGTKVTRGHSRSRTLQIRLNGDEHAELEQLAKVRGLPISTVARSLLLSSLTPSESTQAVIERLERDIAALRQSVGQA